MVTDVRRDDGYVVWWWMYGAVMDVRRDNGCVDGVVVDVRSCDGCMEW